MWIRNTAWLVDSDPDPVKANGSQKGKFKEYSCFEYLPEKLNVGSSGALAQNHGFWIRIQKKD